MGIRVLIVDDDVAFRDGIATVLADRGYHVVGVAATLADARTAITQLDPDAVLLDVQLPDGNGLAFAESIPTPEGRPRVLLTSTDARAAPARVLNRSNAVGFVAKTELIAADLGFYLG